MFNHSFAEAIPGYTGHRQEVQEQQVDLQNPREPRKHIPGK